MKAIYRPKGRAQEYCEYAVNIYNGCPHRCVYCYVPEMIKKTRSEFALTVSRSYICEKVEEDLKEIKGRGIEIQLCFICDPYPALEAKTGRTRQIIQAIKESENRVRILTKAGPLAQRDFDLLGPEDWFGQTLTCDNSADSQSWEPGAALPQERIANLRLAKKKGISTWVSLEPVIYPEQTYQLIEWTREFVDEYKIGKLNYHPRQYEINWQLFVQSVKSQLEKLGKAYYLKNDLRVYDRDAKATR